MKNKSTLRNATFAACVALLAATTACNHDIDEFRFKGIVVGAEMCSSSQIGYVIQLLSPDSLGAAYTNSAGTYNNAIMAYKASRLLHSGDTINGVAYMTESFAALNCFGLIDNGLPEAILLSVDEDE